MTISEITTSAADKKEGAYIQLLYLYVKSFRKKSFTVLQAEDTEHTWKYAMNAKCFVVKLS